MKYIIIVIFASLISCSEKPKAAKNIEVLQYEWVMNKDFTSFSIFPYSYSLITDKGKISYYINENFAVDGFNYSETQIPENEFIEFIEYSDRQLQENASNKAELDHANLFVKVTYNDNTSKTLYIENAVDEPLIKFLQDYFQKNSFVDTLTVEKSRKAAVNLDTVHLNKRMAEIIKLAAINDAKRKVPPPPPSKVDQVKFIKQ